MIGILALSAALASIGSAPVDSRAMWVWKTDAIIRDAQQRQKFFTFLNAPKGDTKARISVVFFACSIGDPSSEKLLRGFLEDAHGRGVRVDYLCGKANYAISQHMGEGLEKVGQVLDFNGRAQSDARFDGIQYDVEPYSLPGWPSENILSSYIAFLDICGKCIFASGQRLSLGVAIPRWYDGEDLHGLYKSVPDRVDYAAIMDYVSKPDEFVAAAANTVSYAAEKGKYVWLGAEASELPLEKTSTFYTLGNAKMEEAFGAAIKAFGTSKGFAGVAVEWYDTYQELKP